MCGRRPGWVVVAVVLLSSVLWGWLLCLALLLLVLLFCLLAGGLSPVVSVLRFLGPFPLVRGFGRGLGLGLLGLLVGLALGVVGLLGLLSVLFAPWFGGALSLAGVVLSRRVVVGFGLGLLLFRCLLLLLCFGLCFGFRVEGLCLCPFFRRRIDKTTTIIYNEQQEGTRGGYFAKRDAF